MALKRLFSQSLNEFKWNKEVEREREREREREGERERWDGIKADQVKVAKRKKPQRHFKEIYCTF